MTEFDNKRLELVKRSLLRPTVSAINFAESNERINFIEVGPISADFFKEVAKVVVDEDFEEIINCLAIDMVNYVSMELLRRMKYLQFVKVSFDLDVSLKSVNGQCYKSYNSYNMLLPESNMSIIKDRLLKLVCAYLSDKGIIVEMIPDGIQIHLQQFLPKEIIEVFTKSAS
jgi:hypothetical protein